MPSLWHDSGIDLFRDDPDLSRRLLQIAGVNLQAGARLFPAPTVETDRTLSRDLSPDTALLVGSVQRPTRVIIVEFQQVQDKGKLRQWPRYAASKWLRYECPVDLLVVCPNETTAEWYARPIPTELPGYTHWPTVLRAEQLPAFTESQQLNADPAMGVMSVAYHGSNPGASLDWEVPENWEASVNWVVVNAFAEGIFTLSPADAKKYYEYALGLSPKVVRIALEHLMSTKYREPFSKLGLTYYGQGREEGREEGLVAGERGTVLMVLKARGLKISDSQREIIDSCTDLAMLKAWAEAALTAETTGQVFDPA